MQYKGWKPSLGKGHLLFLPAYTRSNCQNGDAPKIIVKFNFKLLRTADVLENCVYILFMIADVEKKHKRKKIVAKL